MIYVAGIETQRSCAVKTRTTITIDEELKAKIEELAKRERREFSAQLCILLEEAFETRGQVSA